MHIIKLTPLACLLSVSVWAAPAPAPDAGALGNQLRQTSSTPVRPLMVPSLILPTDTQGNAIASSGNQAHVTLKKIVFTGDVSVTGIRQLSEVGLQQVVLPWVGKSLSFQDMQAMTRAVTQYYRRQGVNQMNIHQNSQHMVTNWNSFDIGQNHTVEFIQPDSSAVALNRVTGGHESQIMGTLKANGQVFLVNPNGVLFGQGASVSTAGLVASTRNISNTAFMKGQYTFSDSGNSGVPGAQIINQGNLITTKGGYIVLAADRVKNNGTVTTPSGRTVLAAAQTVTLQLDGQRCCTMW
ncbi:filamentous hemagglutinin N-terminal domain-containing protein [Salmonella enterica]|nr:filamentous hemagglutinin N-terminal domain-containing protein [Salmonella enterica]EGL8212107.1 filamentous hemagglutinin N-terminal domain-containing protein [Salmonella enterica]EHU4633256.1 filamentous hemagglutinin N-terminal domain-containing protein [Salmonella enterica]ELE3167751.1 filamentous hemagglutinin N-terminal domain-containing protein [Salmonella enterica]